MSQFAIRRNGGTTNQPVALNLSSGRLNLVLIVMLLAIFFLFFNLVRIQLFQHDHYAKLATSQRRVVEELPSERGRIMDRNGEILADNLNRIGVYALKQQVKDSRETALKLSKVLNIGYDKLLADLSSNSDFIWLARNLDNGLKDTINELALPGINVADDPVRVYPQGRLAAHVLGGVGKDNSGLFGIESSYEYYLAGLPGRSVGEGDALGREVYSTEEKSITPTHGCNIELTIDYWCQHVVEEALRRQVEKSSARGGVAVVMDCRTGEILALASLPDFDPNHWGDVPKDNWRPRAITDAFEPGSCMKPFIIAHALASGIINTNETFDCRMPFAVADRKISDIAKHPDDLNAADIIKYSSNVGVAHIGLRMGNLEIMKALVRFGFGTKCGLELSGETSGRMPARQAAGEVATAFASFGYGLQVSPVQLARAMAVLANGGYLITPHIISQMKDAEGKVIEDLTENHASRRVLDAGVAAVVRQMLINGVEEGGGKQAKVKGYSVGGKTGTAQKAREDQNGYNIYSFRASFVGFAPAEMPRVVIVVSIDEPQGEYYGGQVAAPVFSEICTRILPYLNVAPDGSNVVIAPPVAAGIAIGMPNLVGMDVFAATKLVQSMGCVASISGIGSLVESQSPGPGNAVNPGEVVQMRLKGKNATMPDITGMPAGKAVSLLVAMGLTPELNGSGRVAGQSPAAGATITSGSLARLDLR